MNHLPLLIRREFWEHRSLVIAPAIVAAICVVMTLLNGGDLFAALKETMRHAPPAAFDWLPALVVFGLSTAFAVVMSIVTAFYLLDSLYSDRKDRSVYFWKSMPVSDTATVVSKLVTGAGVVPLLTFAVALVTGLLVALISSVHLSIAGVAGAWGHIWNARAWFGTQGLMLYTTVVATLWFLPLFAWLLLASAWARKAVFLWAILPPVLLMVAESTIQTHFVASLIGDRLTGWHVAYNWAGMHNLKSALDQNQIPDNVGIGDLIDPAAYLTSPGLWLGLAVAALFTWGAIEIRRRRTEV
jgi:ABC-2 type transport system permease protein